MAVAMTVDLMSATVQLEQPLSDGTRTVATGFLVSDPTPDGRPRVVLITADHVFEGMPSDQATIGYRVKGADGAWTFAPKQCCVAQAATPSFGLPNDPLDAATRETDGKDGCFGT